MAYLCKLPPSEILKQAKALIESRHKSYGCHAIQKVIVDNCEIPIVPIWFGGELTNEQCENPEPFSSCQDIYTILEAETSIVLAYLEPYRETDPSHNSFWSTRAARLAGFDSAIDDAETVEAQNG